MRGQGTDPVAVDAACATFMGFDPASIPIVREAFHARGWAITDVEPGRIAVVSDEPAWNAQLTALAPATLFRFRPHFGWAGRIEAPWRLASPVTHVAATSPPVLILQGAADTTVDRAQSTGLASVLAAKGVPHELVVLDGVGHTFDLQSWRGKPLPLDLRPVLLRFLMQHLAGPVK